MSVLVIGVMLQIGQAPKLVSGGKWRKLWSPFERVCQLYISTIKTTKTKIAINVAKTATHQNMECPRNIHVHVYMYMYSGAPWLSLYKDTSEMKTSP